MKKKARLQGNFPQAGPNSAEWLYNKFQQIGKAKEVSQVQQRRIMIENRMNYELETERMMADMRRARMPAFRGEGARMMGVDRVAEQIIA
jgi:hypothetical protein